ncbi:class I SAM-dependent methyltransferase [Engelhardtia mirabilis]|uniref:Methyltransferase type 11 domain-containing protein n=1 Tax=Engelhardtia mirabilis TaxID=2528011 RepID=A0A518BLE0_9BACT|nr:hypothetical protein Pla133_28760 [Planctomycetes bacterium Pla133]QDV02113.1 hypothetical protein Pla86_28750 [Planctomycetes bacterium Pla86]
MEAVVHQEHDDPDHWWFRARRAIFDDVLDGRVPLGPNARILDVGPGSGVNLPVLAPRGRVVTLDVAAGSLQNCAAKGATPVRGDATAAPFADGSFQLIAALDVLEHLEAETAALSEWRRLLADDGKLLLSVPALQLLWGRQDVLAMHHRRYGRRELAQKLRAAGFELERLTYFNSLLFAPILALRLAMRPLLDRAHSGGSDLGLRLPRPLEQLLYHTFAVERHWVVDRNLPLGVSLLALARPVVR